MVTVTSLQKKAIILILTKSDHGMCGGVSIYIYIYILTKVMLISSAEYVTSKSRVVEVLVSKWSI